MLATLSPQWIATVRESGRFAKFSWESRVETVEVTTLDELIRRHGKPAFCKIDVEGYEPEVLAGLSVALRALSFEFTPERPEASERCIGRLLQLGAYEFNYSFGESLMLESPSWISGDEIAAVLAALRDDHFRFGDVYARLVAGTRTEQP